MTHKKNRELEAEVAELKTDIARLYQDERATGAVISFLKDELREAKDALAVADGSWSKQVDELRIELDCWRALFGTPEANAARINAANALLDRVTGCVSDKLLAEIEAYLAGQPAERDTFLAGHIAELRNNLSQASRELVACSTSLDESRREVIRLGELVHSYEHQPRAEGCECDQEEGDSPCPVHGMNEEDDIDLNDGADFVVEGR